MKPSLVVMDEGHESCKELGTTTKNPPAYGEWHGMKDGAVNWGDPPLHRKKTVKRYPISLKGEVGYLQEGSPRGS
jgi:hypothetical protein